MQQKKNITNLKKFLRIVNATIATIRIILLIEILYQF